MLGGRYRLSICRKQGKTSEISLEFDGSNKSLKAAKLLSTMPEDMTKSISADIIKNRPKRDGPFSQTQQSFTKSDASSDDEHIIRAGSREEMAAFARDCMEQSDVTLRIDLPILRLLVPNHQFLELLYNRLVNGFALWKPSAPVFTAKNNSLNITFDDGFREVKSSLRTVQEDSDDEDDLNDYSRTERISSARRAQSHAFALNLDVVKGTMVMGTDVAHASGDGTALQPAQVVSELGGTQLFVCSGFHGDANQTFFHMTTTNVTVAQRNEPTIPNNVLHREFGSHDRSEVHLRSLAAGSTLREGRRDDSLAVALHIVTSQAGRVQETTAAIALRLFELNLIPVKRIEENWMMQLKNLFALTDFEIPGYEMPVCNTYLHVHLDHVVLAYDHCRIVKGSPLKFKFVLGNVDINSTIVPSMKVNKFLCLFERVHLHMMKEYDEMRTVSYDDDEPKIKKAPNMVHIMEIGFFQLELLMLNELMAREDETRNSPLFELRCQNDQIKAWVCHDSLVTLVNSIVEVTQADMWKEETPESDLLTEDETRSESSAFTKSTASTMKTGILMSPDAERRLKLLVEDALEDAPIPPTPTPSTYEEHDEDSQTQLNLLEDAMRDLGMGQEPGMSRASSFSTDDSFVMVDNIPGCGITSLSGEPRIRLIDPDDMAESGEYYYNYIPEHIASGDFRSDRISLPPDHPLPLIRCQLKDISIQLHIFGGSDLGHGPDLAKSYSSDEYKNGAGRGQRIAMEARGGTFRDHSVAVCLELDKISYLHQMFDKEATVRSMNFITIQDVTIHDKLTLSNIKEMLYQYSTTEHPRRTCAPMVAVRMVENQEQEAKLRVSMLPIRLNIDQDTMEFIEDFIQAVSRGLALPESATPRFINQPSIEVPSGIEPSAPPLSIRSSSRSRSRSSSSCPSLSSLNDQPMTSSAVYPALSPQPSIPNKRKDSTNRLDMDAAQLQVALDEIDRPGGDWASSTSDLLSRSTMEGSIYGGGLDDHDDGPITDEPILTSDRFAVNLNEDDEAGAGRYGEEEEDRETICSEAPRPRSLSENEEQIGGATFFKEFIFSPGCTIYVDYHGKNKYNIEKSGAVLGVLKGFGQLNRTEINLKPFECRNGLLGMGRCVSHAITEWQEDIVANIPYALSSVGPISPFFQIGKGICDLFYLPVSEMRKEDGHVVKGLQRGASSFGYSTAAAMVDLAQKLVGAVQITAESVLYELTPTHPSLNNRNRRPVQQLMHNPRDMQHGMQLAYDLIATGVQQTREDLELAAQEDRASGRSSVQSVLRHATPALLRPFIIGSQIGYHFLGGIKNQLRPDQFHDEQHKWRNERDRAGTGGN
ncbi:hypothetical protein PRIPAC_72004 [Pristionchus pacificus]|nr:hypothetical protein PRIPAC_72004 [Pristionchus pacificus]